VTFAVLASDLNEDIQRTITRQMAYSLIAHMALAFLGYNWKIIGVLRIKVVCINLVDRKEIRIMAIGPAGQMEVDEKMARWTSEYERQNYYACDR